MIITQLLPIMFKKVPRMSVKSCYVRKIGYEMACIIYQNSGGKKNLRRAENHWKTKVSTRFEE